jgi:hypothetical protein
MIKVSIMYPNGPETTFDVDYYKIHLPMIAESLGGFKGMEFNVGIGGRVPSALCVWDIFF